MHKQEDLLDKLLCKEETLDKEDEEDDEVGDLYPASFSQHGRKREAIYVKPRGLSFEDLAATPISDQKSANESMPARRKESSPVKLQTSPPSKSGALDMTPILLKPIHTTTNATT